MEGRKWIDGKKFTPRKNKSASRSKRKAARSRKSRSEDSNGGGFMRKRVASRKKILQGVINRRKIREKF